MVIPKFKNAAEAAAIVQSWQDAGQEVVFTNGVFDILHVGHVRYLQASRLLGDKLIIGLNADDSVRRRLQTYQQSRGKS